MKVYSEISNHNESTSRKANVLITMMANKKFVPFQVLQVEISDPIDDLRTSAGHPGQRVLALIRLHSLPVGVVEVEIEHSGMSAEAFASRIWQDLGDEINEHLREDGLPPTHALPADGIQRTGTPRCEQQRAAFLARAPYTSVLVATHNRVATLGPCLDSLLALEYPNFDIIVIDNAPANNDTAAFVNQKYARTGRVRYVREDHAGLASAHNAGLAATNAPYIAITDDDVIVDRSWLAELMRGFFRAENVGCVTGMIFPAEIATEAQYWIERSAGYAKGYGRKLFDLDRNRPDSPLFPYAAGMFGSGANMAFDTQAIRALGGFDDSLGAGSIALGGDDLASFYSIIAAGHTLVYEPAAIIYHRHYREYERLRKTAYGYGAGLTAYLTGALLAHPGRVFDLARRAPLGLYYAVSAHSPKNARKAEDYPRELTAIERKGMLAGPILYLRSRWNTRGLKKRRQEAGIHEGIHSIERGQNS